MNIFKRSFWGLSTTFWGLMLGAVIVGGQIAETYSGQINSFLNIDTFIKVDDSTNDTPDVMYFKSDFMQYRWHKNEDGKFEFQQRWNKEGLNSYIRDVTKRVDAEGTVLLWNNNNALPLKNDSKISLFGTNQLPSNYITSGEGSGAHAANTNDSLKACLEADGVKVNPDLYSKYEIAGMGKKWKMFNSWPNGDLNVVEFSVNEVKFDEIKTTADATVSQYGDAAIMIISRNGSENGDLNFNAPESINGNYQDLTNEEKDILDNLVKYKNDGKIKNIVLVLNTCNPMQMKNISKYDIDACLWSGNGGTSSFRALGDVLTGKLDPSGHLADTYLYDNYSAPSTVNQGDFTYTDYNSLPATTTYTHNTKYLVYQEGIYVGYKYFETRYEDQVLNQGNASGTFGVKNSSSNWVYNQEVAFPFGHGGSYATFERSDYKVTYNNGLYNCSIKIKNTSSEYSGQDTFQIYLQKPYTEYDKQNNIEKSSVELVGFAKTKSLKPNEEQTLNVTIKEKDLTSYDSYNKKTYILEKGDYYLATGLSSHDALNNILKAKNASSSYYDNQGDAKYVHKIEKTEDDFTTYSVSEKTGNKITNQFDNADVNLYKNTQDQKTTYLSRSNWEGTYPTGASLKCTNLDMINDMQYTLASEEVNNTEGVNMPLYNQDNGLSLIDLMYEDYNSEKWNQLLDQMSYEEQCKLVLYGSNAIAGAASINAPGAKSMDGPAGMRLAEGTNAYPSETLMATTFNLPLIEEMGEAFGMEMLSNGYTGIYGPGANIHRSNNSGRNFEYYSEDGVLSGLMLNAELKGLTNKGVIAFAKHFLMNDQERNRYGVATFANEQTIREIYLKAFQYSIEEDNTIGLMSSFNRIGCTWTGAHKGLLTEVLRNEWGFKGVVETDAGAADFMTHKMALVNGVVAGQDLWMMGKEGNEFGEYKSNPVVAQGIRRACKNNLYAQVHSNTMNGLKSGVLIVEVTPWWKNLILGLEIGVGIVTFACLGLTITSFILKRKEDVENEK